MHKSMNITHEQNSCIREIIIEGSSPRQSIKERRVIRNKYNRREYKLNNSGSYDMMTSATVTMNVKINEKFLEGLFVKTRKVVINYHK